MEKRKLPKFIRQKTHTKSRLKKVWRKPKGIQSKQRLSHKGHMPLVKIGYGNPKELKHTFKGKQLITIHNSNELKDLKDCYIIIASVGAKKKIRLIELATKQGLEVLNLKGFAERSEAKLKANKEKRAKIFAKRSNKKAKAEKKPAEKTTEKTIEKKAEKKPAEKTIEKKTEEKVEKKPIKEKAKEVTKK